MSDFDEKIIERLKRLEREVERLQVKERPIVYPVGSIYMSVNSTDPGTIFGGTWVAWGTGRVPVGIDASQTEFNTVEETGGEKKHTLSTAEMPSHAHNLNRIYQANGFSTPYTEPTPGWGLPTSGGGSGLPIISSTGGGEAHNNLQPYIVCYMWKRTA